MSIFKDIEIALDPIIDEAKEWAGKAIDFLKDVPITIAQKAVALVKETSLGTAIMNLISAASTHDIPGSEKFSNVFDAVKDAYAAFTSHGGLSGLIAAGVNILRELIESLVNDFKATFAS